MGIHPFKFGLPFVLLAMPFLYLWASAKDQAAWLVAIGVYFFASVLVSFSYLQFAYRLSVWAILGRLFVGAMIALLSAAVYALAVTGSVDGLFAVKPHT